MFRSQQIQIMKTLVTLLFITMAAVGQAKAFTANDILTSCEALLRNFKPLGGEQMSIPNQGAQCANYISAFQGLSALIENNNDGDGRILKICAPPESTLVQFIRIYASPSSGKRLVRDLPSLKISRSVYCTSWKRPPV